METLNVSSFRKDLSTYLDMADQGQPVLIRRKNQYYTLVCVGSDNLTITPELQKRIDEARHAYRDGKCVTCATPDDLQSFLDAL